MGYADRKTRVIDIILTNKGRHRFSLGELGITYYAFSDDNVDYRTVYDGSPPMSGSVAISEVKRSTLCTEPSIRSGELEIQSFIFDSESDTKPRLKSSDDAITIEQKIKRITVQDAIAETSRGVTGRVTFVARERPSGTAIPVDREEYGEGEGGGGAETIPGWLDAVMETVGE